MLILWNLHCSPAYSDDKMWRCLIDHVVFGRCVILIHKDRAKLGDGIFDRLLLPPFRKNMLLDRETKRYMVFNLDYWEQWTKKLFDGAKCTIVPGPTTIHGLLSCQHKFILRDGREARVWTTQDVKTTPSLANALCNVCSIPPGYGLPVRLVISSPKSHYSEVWFEVKATRLLAMDQREFETPKDYQRADDIVEATLTPKNSKYADSAEQLFQVPVK